MPLSREAMFIRIWLNLLRGIIFCLTSLSCSFTSSGSLRGSYGWVMVLNATSLLSVWELTGVRRDFSRER